MLLELSLGAELLVADGAAPVPVALLSTVLPLRLLGDERPVAVVAFELLLVGMFEHVVGQIVLVVEDLAADGTGQLRSGHLTAGLQLVDVSEVFPQILAEKERFLTNTARNLNNYH